MARSLRSTRALRTLVACLATAWLALPAHAQTPEPLDAQAPAHVSFVDGVVVLERDGQIDSEPGNMPLLAGDRLRTRGGRVEVLFADGSTLHLDQHSAVDLQSDDLIRLVAGRIRLTIPGPDRGVAYRIDGPHGWARITEPGEYRVALLNAPGGQELELAVIRGHAELANEGGQTALRAGERAFVRAGAAPSYAYVANSAALDAFDRWSDLRREERMAASAEYLPEEVRPYAASFETHGYWSDEPTYGRVWYPRVAHDWRPYYRGRWVNLRPYGWTWVAHDPWGWPTHHYGRWGISTAGAWFWIPGRSWGAAWVSWAYAPGYVSWCPLGWNNRPIFQININTGRHYDPWRAWTVVPHRRFGYGYVHRNVVRASLIDVRVRGAFTHRERAPEIRGYAVPRSAAPIRVAGTGGSRRGSSPLYTNLPADQARIRSDGARIRVPGATPAERGARPSAAVPRERAVPTRPAVRADRPTERAVRPGEPSSVQRAPSDGARPRGAVRSATPADARRSSSPAATSRDAGRVESPRSAPPAAQPAAADQGRRAVPRAAPAPRGGTAPGRVESPPAIRGSDALTPRRIEPPRALPPSAARSRTDAPRPAPSPRADVPSHRPGGGQPVYRQPSAARGASQPPAAARPESRAPAASAPPSGSPAGARPSAPSARPSSGGGGRPSAPAARPSNSGGSQARPTAVPRGGGPGGGVVR